MFKKLATILALTSATLFNYGCATYKTISPDSIKPVQPRMFHLQSQIYHQYPPNFNQLTWQQAIKCVQTPEQAQDYLNRHMISRRSPGIDIGGLFITSDNHESFKSNHQDRTGVCSDYAICAAALLSDNNYPPLILALKQNIFNSHGVFIYRNQKGLFGALGNTPFHPEYNSINQLAKEFKKQYGWDFKQFAIIDLNKTYPNQKWIWSDKKLIETHRGIKFHRIK